MVVDTSTYDIKRKCDSQILRELEINPEYCYVKFKKNTEKLKVYLDENCPDWSTDSTLVYRNQEINKRWILFAHLKKRLADLEIALTHHNPSKKFRILLFKEHITRQYYYQSPSSFKYSQLLHKIFKRSTNTD